MDHTSLSSSTVDMLPTYFLRFILHFVMQNLSRAKEDPRVKYVVKHKSAKLLMMYAVGKLEAALNISHYLKYKQSEQAVRAICQS